MHAEWGIHIEAARTTAGRKLDLVDGEIVGLDREVAIAADLSSGHGRHRPATAWTFGRNMEARHAVLPVEREVEPLVDGLLVVLLVLYDQRAVRNAEAVHRGDRAARIGQNVHELTQAGRGLAHQDGTFPSGGLAGRRSILLHHRRRIRRVVLRATAEFDQRTRAVRGNERKIAVPQQDGPQRDVEDLETFRDHLAEHQRERVDGQFGLRCGQDRLTIRSRDREPRDGEARVETVLDQRGAADRETEAVPEPVLKRAGDRLTETVDRDGTKTDANDGGHRQQPDDDDKKHADLETSQGEALQTQTAATPTAGAEPDRGPTHVFGLCGHTVPVLAKR